MNQYTLLRIKERMNKELYDTLKTHITIDETISREEEIRQEALKAEKEEFPRCAGDKENSFHGVNSAYGLGFVDGALWADANPKSPWISVKDDLPYKHNGLISPDDKRDTKCVFTLINGCITLNMMYKLDGKWHWRYDKPTHWMPLPELPKE